MHDDGYFGEEVASTYDDDTAIFEPAVVDPMIDFLFELAGGGRALEFGIGTGRIAIPLAQRGVPVSGIDLSQAMLDRLKPKPGAEDIEVATGSFASTRIDGSFSLVYLIFNTIGNLTTQREQVDCFRNAAAHLEPGGHFVIEVGVPDLQRLPPGQTYRVFHASEDRWGIDEVDVANQGLISHHFWQAERDVRRVSMPFRYVWPSEMDLMAEIAGMSPKERWQDWDREPFTSESRKIVAVWQKPAD